jgi:hypothetical protein
MDAFDHVITKALNQVEMDAKIGFAPKDGPINEEVNETGSPSCDIKTRYLF